MALTRVLGDGEGYQVLEEKMDGLAENKANEYYVKCLRASISRYKEGLK